MEDKENADGIFGGIYNKLICKEADEQPLYSNQEKQQGIVNVYV